MGALPPAAWALCPTAALALCPTRQGDPSVKYAVERLLAHPPHSNYFCRALITHLTGYPAHMLS